MMGRQNYNITVADHTITSDIDSLLKKVNLNSAFTNLGKNDAQLVQEMKTAVTELYR